MKNIIATSLVIAGLVLGTQASFANNLKKIGPGSTVLKLGNFDANCLGNGRSNCEFRTVAVGDHNQLVAHLQARGVAGSSVGVENLENSNVLMLTPITVQVIQGNTQYFSVLVEYLREGNSTPVFASFITPGSKLIFDAPGLLVNNGNNTFSVPLALGGNRGVPKGARLISVQPSVNGTFINCDLKTIDLNHVSINGRFIGLDTTAPASTAECGSGCGRGGTGD